MDILEQGHDFVGYTFSIIVQNTPDSQLLASLDCKGKCNKQTHTLWVILQRMIPFGLLAEIEVGLVKICGDQHRANPATYFGAVGKL